MSEIKIFENEQFGEVRTIEEDGKVLFCGSDCAKALGYAKPQNAISMHCRYALKRGIPTKQGNMSEMLFIPEGDLYRLITHSKLPAAEKFEKWVFDEVLPSIRKYGSYIAGQERMSDDELIEKVAAAVQKIIAEQGKTIKDIRYNYNPFNPGESADKQRIKKLNRLAGRVSKLCGLKRNKTLHYLYKTIEENLGVDIDSYSAVYAKTSGDGWDSTIDVICKYDNLYREAVRLCEETIERKQIFG